MEEKKRTKKSTYLKGDQKSLTSKVRKNWRLEKNRVNKETKRRTGRSEGLATPRSQNRKEERKQNRKTVLDQGDESYSIHNVDTRRKNRKRIRNTDNLRSNSERVERKAIREMDGNNDHSVLSLEEKRGRKKREDNRVKTREKTFNRLTENSSENQVKEKQGERKEWKEQVVRVGTGYRVRRDQKDNKKRRFDVGYADRKEYKRENSREVKVDASNRGRTVEGKGKDSRVKVMNAVAGIEKRRPVSKYTGSGIMRKSMVGKRKLKPTKPKGKEA